MNKIIPFISQDDTKNNYRYAVYQHSLLTKEGILYHRYFIVLKNQFDIIVHFTSLHNYTGVYQNKIYKPITSDARVKMLYICKMLNYLIFESKRLSRIEEITKVDLEVFFQHYAIEITSSGRHKGSQSVEKCISTNVKFMNQLIKKSNRNLAIKKEELFLESTTKNHHNKLQKTQKPNFSVEGIVEYKKIFRDIPNVVFEKILELALKYTPDIVFGIALQCFAGLRPGEVCNIRRENSPLGSGIQITRMENRVVKIELDLTKEINLRSDGINCGKIKKERKQSIYPKFIQAFLQFYEHHKHFLMTRKYEMDFAPMFINQSGKAMTYACYAAKIRNLVSDYLIPALLSSSDGVCQIYGQKLLENSFGPHAFRHWFSVQLVLFGEGIEQLQFWRGDSSPESAFLYLQNKGALTKELEWSNEQLFTSIIKKGHSRHEQESDFL